MLDNIIYIIMAMVTVWIVYKYLDIFLVKKTNNFLKTIIPWLSFYVYQIFLEKQKEKSFLLTLFINIIFVLAIMIIEYAGTIRSKLIKTVSLYVMWMLVECFTDAIVSFIHIEKTESYIMGSVLSKILLIVLLQLLYRRNQMKNIMMPWNYWLMLFIVPISSIYISYIIYLSGNKANGNFESFNLLAFILLLLINIVIFEVYDKLSYISYIETENKIFEQQLVLLANYNEEKEKNYYDSRREQHDYINQMMAVKNNIKKGDSSEAIRLLDDILNICNDNIYDISKSGNDIIDTLINYKYSIAKKKGIEFHLQIFIPEKLPFAQRDLCVIIGNALDNAIEATEKSAYPLIEVYLGIRKETFVMVIKNTFTGNIKRNKEGKIVTSKKDKKYHGFGLNSIEKATQKYQGQAIVEIKNREDKKEQEFILTITLDWKTKNFDKNIAFFNT